jgi:uncharacterized protein YndB with AHSA1/START domain
MMSAETSANATAPDRDLLITRTFDAPRELVFKAWTDETFLQRWYAPNGCTIEFYTLDCIHNPSYGPCIVSGVYQEVVAPERLVLTMFLADREGNMIEPDVKHPKWPQVTTLTVTFEDLGGMTKVTLAQTVSEALAKETGAYPSWLQMLDRLAENLATA